MFIKERALRLIFPYLIGALTYVSIVTALFRTIEGSYTLQYSVYDPRNFIDFYFTEYFTLQNIIYIVLGWHLWFLVILFIFNLILHKHFIAKVFNRSSNENYDEKKKKKPSSKPEHIIFHQFATQSTNTGCHQMNSSICRKLHRCLLGYPPILQSLPPSPSPSIHVNIINNLLYH